MSRILLVVLAFFAGMIGTIGLPDEALAQKRVALVIGMMRDKDVTGTLSALLPLADTLVCTTPSSPRALPAAELAARAAALPSLPRYVTAIDDPADAMASVVNPA